MRHALWLMPLMLGICLMAWCLNHPTNGSGREFLAVLLMLVSIIMALFVRYDRANLDYTPEYQEIHVTSKIRDFV